MHPVWRERERERERESGKESGKMRHYYCLRSRSRVEVLILTGNLEVLDGGKGRSLYVRRKKRERKPEQADRRG